MNYRLYTFVAGLYLSELQKGLQTAHVVGELMTRYKPNFNDVGDSVYDWAAEDKTIIICDAGNHKGVLDCWAELKRTGIDPGFVAGAIFHEDEQSMNGMATACGVIVPQQYWDVQFEESIMFPPMGRYVHSVKDANGAVTDLKVYPLTHPEGQFIAHIKKYRLA